jgi:hypothetical protein
MISLEDRNAIFEICDGRYVLREECDTKMSNAENRIADLDKRLAIIETRLNLNNWLTGLIAAGIVALVIKVFLGG